MFSTRDFSNQHRTMTKRTPKYVPPSDWKARDLRKFVSMYRPFNEQRQLSWAEMEEHYYSGDLGLLDMPCVSIVGTRNVSKEGAQRARKLAKLLVSNEVVVVSGLAKGVDYNAHTAAIEAGGHTIAVIGTPLDKAYPAEHKRLQEEIYKKHLLISPFKHGKRTYPSDFPKRNRLMATISDATVIIEAGETSGTIHQASECKDLGRHLFFAKSLVENPDVTWPQRFLNGYENAKVLESIDDILSIL